MQRYIADLGRAWPVLLLFGGLVPLLFSVLWLILVCYFIRPTVWITLALLNVLALLVTLFFYVKGRDPSLNVILYFGRFWVRRLSHTVNYSPERYVS